MTIHAFKIIEGVSFDKIEINTKSVVILVNMILSLLPKHLEAITTHKKSSLNYFF